jgi:hypothetical protein
MQNDTCRPVGSRNKATLALEQLLRGQGEALMQKLIKSALKSDPTAMRLCMERVYPVRREQPVKLQLPQIHTAGDVTAAFRAVLQAMAQGDITTSQAESVTRLLEFGRKSIETEELARSVVEMRAELQEMREKS